MMRWDQVAVGYTVNASRSTDMIWSEGRVHFSSVFVILYLSPGFQSQLHGNRSDSG